MIDATGGGAGHCAVSRPCCQRVASRVCSCVQVFGSALLNGKVYTHSFCSDDSDCLPDQTCFLTSCQRQGEPAQRLHRRQVQRHFIPT